MITQLLQETKDTFTELYVFYQLMKDLNTKFSKPTQDDALSFAFTEAGELLDAYMRIYMSHYVRNNEREVDDSDMWMEYAQCMVMMMMSLPREFVYHNDRPFAKFGDIYQIYSTIHDPISLNNIKSVCVDVSNIFYHSNSFNLQTSTRVIQSYSVGDANITKLNLINNMMYTLLKYNKFMFFYLVLDKWLQNHYVKHLKPVFINTFTNEEWRIKITIDNVFILYAQNKLKVLKWN